MTIAAILELTIYLLDIVASQTKTDIDDKVLKFIKKARENLVKARSQKLSRKRLYEWKPTPRW